MEEQRQQEEEAEDEEHEKEQQAKDVTPSGFDIDSQAVKQQGHATLPAPAPSAPTPLELQQVEVELRLLEALEVYHPSKLLGMHRHFILYGLMENLQRRLNYHFTAQEILGLLDRFYNLEFLKPDEEEGELLSQEEEFSLPASILSIKEGPKGSC
ncbi:hypothetical protein R1sor_023927 [Riccia sorocarpa]|uniref:Uncharacterized protein n=1 Tax=Riccia sorocarpa TaxID=122646 RepID=A0ABD3GQV5_9MARC